MFLINGKYKNKWRRFFVKFRQELDKIEYFISPKLLTTSVVLFKNLFRLGNSNKSTKHMLL